MSRCVYIYIYMYIHIYIYIYTLRTDTSDPKHGFMSFSALLAPKRCLGRVLADAGLIVWKTFASLTEVHLLGQNPVNQWTNMSHVERPTLSYRVVIPRTAAHLFHRRCV